MKLRRIAALLLGTIMVVGLAGCGGSDEGSTSGSRGSKSVKTDVIRVWTDMSQDRDLRLEQVERFNQTTGKELGIEIEYTVHGSDWHNLIRIAAQSGEAPHIYRPNGQFFSDFVSAGYFVPLSDFPELNDLVAKYEGSSPIENQKIQLGDVYTLPFSLTSYKMAINRDLFDKNGLKDLPKDWNEVREYAKIVTENGNGTEYGYGFGLQSMWTATAYMTRPSQQDVGHFGFNNETLKFQYIDFLPKFEAFAGMVTDGSIFPGYSGMDAATINAQFVDGRIAMVTCFNNDAALFSTSTSNIEIVDLPTHDGGPRKYKQFVDATNAFAIGENALENDRIKEKVAVVYEFLYSDENATELYEHSIHIPYSETAIANATKKPEGLFSDFVIPADDRVIMIPSIENMVSMEGMSFQETLLSIVAEKPTGTPKEILTELDERINAAVAKQFTPEQLEAYKPPANWDPLAK